MKQFNQLLFNALGGEIALRGAKGMDYQDWSPNNIRTLVISCHFIAVRTWVGKGSDTFNITPVGENVLREYAMTAQSNVRRRSFLYHLGEMKTFQNLEELIVDGSLLHCKAMQLLPFFHLEEISSINNYTATKAPTFMGNFDEDVWGLLNGESRERPKLDGKTFLLAGVTLPTTILVIKDILSDVTPDLSITETFTSGNMDINSVMLYAINTTQRGKAPQGRTLSLQPNVYPLDRVNNALGKFAKEYNDKVRRSLVARDGVKSHAGSSTSGVDAETNKNTDAEDPYKEELTAITKKALAVDTDNAKRVFNLLSTIDTLFRHSKSGEAGEYFKEQFKKARTIKVDGTRVLFLKGYEPADKNKLYSNNTVKNAISHLLSEKFAFIKVANVYEQSVKKYKVMYSLGKRGFFYLPAEGVKTIFEESVGAYYADIAKKEFREGALGKLAPFKGNNTAITSFINTVEKKNTVRELVQYLKDRSMELGKPPVKDWKAQIEGDIPEGYFRNHERAYRLTSFFFEYIANKLVEAAEVKGVVNTVTQAAQGVHVEPNPEIPQDEFLKRLLGSEYDEIMSENDRYLEIDSLKYYIDRSFRDEISYFSKMPKSEFRAYYNLIDDILHIEGYVVDMFGPEVVGQMEVQIAPHNWIGNGSGARVKELYKQNGTIPLEGNRLSLEEFIDSLIEDGVSSVKFVMPIGRDDVVKVLKHKEIVTYDKWQKCVEHYKNAEQL